MKLRSGFVSNSSSSSFVIVVPNKDNLSKEQIIEQLKKDFEWEFECYEENGSHSEECEKMLNYVEQGCVVKNISIEYGGEDAVREVCDLIGVEYWSGDY